MLIIRYGYVTLRLNDGNIILTLTCANRRGRIEGEMKGNEGYSEENPNRPYKNTARESLRRKMYLIVEHFFHAAVGNQPHNSNEGVQCQRDPAIDEGKRNSGGIYDGRNLSFEIRSKRNGKF